MQNEETILKWLNGELDQKELDNFKESDDYKVLEPIISQTGKLAAPDFDVEIGLEKLRGKKSKRIGTKPFRWLNVAAIALFCLLVGGAAYFIGNTKTLITTGLAERTTVSLPDASEVQLNAKSEIKYHKRSWQEHREVILDGEAFFKVAKGKTFTVNTSYGTVQVLGTQFNVRKRKDLFEVSCYEGRVSVTLSGRTAVLTPGKSIAMVDGNLRDVRSVSGPLPVWLMEESSFGNVPLSMVLEELQRQYDVKVKIRDKALLEKKFTGSFVNNDLVKALEVISYITDLKYDLKENKVVELYAK